jgi:hypothetical protein
MLPRDPPHPDATRRVTIAQHRDQPVAHHVAAKDDALSRQVQQHVATGVRRPRVKQAYLTLAEPHRQPIFEGQPRRGDVHFLDLSSELITELLK